LKKDSFSPILDETIKEALYRFTASPVDLYCDDLFKPQAAFVKDPSRFVAAQCSRRAGKSNGLALRFFRTLETHPGAFCPYIALTRESARNIMWPVLLEQDAKYRIGCHFTESDLTVTHPNGARLQLFGADMKNFIRRLKGIKTPGAGIDEAQDFGPHLSSLVDDVLTPTLTDYKDSWLAITGTPGPVPKGYFYEITKEGKYGFSKHFWTLLDNPYLPGAKDFLDELKKKREWDESNPTLRREWYNEWVLDVESLLIKWNEEKNDYHTLPPAKYSYILGVDIGLRDADALAVLAWSESSPIIYLVEEVITSGQDITALSNQIQTLMNRYDISKIVMDEGGLGKKAAEEIRRRKHIPVQAADKARKMENVAFLNDYLRLGKFKAKKNSRFVKDSFQVQIDWDKSTPDRLVVKDSFHSDIIDSVLYAFKDSPAYTWSPEEPKPRWGEPAWVEKELKEMEDQAEQHFLEQEEARQGPTGWGW
jgi:hypothetical protein